MRRILRIKLCKGFTLTELLLVIVILGIAAVAAVPSFISYYERSADKSCRAYAEDIAAETEKHLVTACFSEREDADKMISELLYKRSVSDITVLDSDEKSRSTSIKTMSGELYIISWEYDEENNIFDFSVTCTEHSIEISRKFRLSFVSGSGYIKP